MNDSFISQIYLCGESRRKLTELVVSVGAVKPMDENRWECKVKLSGYLNDEYDAQEPSSFNSLIIGIAYLRQALRKSLEKSNKLKFYEDIGGEIIERSIEDIFWIHDCISDEMEDMVVWAKENGYKSD